MAVTKALAEKVVVDHRTDLIIYLYFMLFEICKLDLQSKILSRKIQVINAYKKQVGRGCI